MTIVLALTLAAAGADLPPVKIGEKVERRGDEIMACGQLYHTSTRVVLWTDPGGYDAYRIEPRFTPLPPKPPEITAKNAPRGVVRYGRRTRGLSAEELERVRGGGWDLPLLSRVIDQFVIHFDARGTSRECFQVLERRGLSVQFMLDLDGTIYQTLDVKEAAWHATIANQRSIGVEVANIGAYPEAGPDPLARWYQAETDGQIRLVNPEPAGAVGPFAGQTVLRPRRGEMIVGKVQGQRLKQYDFTSQQYEALARLTATLCRLFPQIRCDYPRDSGGKLVPHKLPEAEYAKYRGILGHYHVQLNKVDPGPAFQWDLVIESTRKLLK
jgi:N-acetyl-anhydromuramyl-L-alanine amidase AmpD